MWMLFIGLPYFSLVDFFLSPYGVQDRRLDTLHLFASKIINLQSHYQRTLLKKKFKFDC